jgi:hypothetical protein
MAANNSKTESSTDSSVHGSKTKRKVLFIICLLAVGALFLPYMSVSYKMYENVRPKRPEGYPWFEFEDLKITLVSGIIILAGK